MTRLALLFATLLGACAGTIESQPAYVASPSYGGRVTTRWVTLADRYSGATPSQQILTRGMGDFRRIRIEGAGGAPVIDHVTIDYENQPPQIVPVQARLTPGQGKTIPLNGDGAVKRVIVYSDPAYGGRYNVYGG